MASFWCALLICLISAPAGWTQGVTNPDATELVTEIVTSDTTTIEQSLDQSVPTQAAVSVSMTMKPTAQQPTTQQRATQKPTLAPTTPDPCPSGCTCTPSTRTAVCISLSSGIPTFPSYITTLILNNNRLSTLPNDAFTGLSDLIRLYLISCEIGNIEPGAFNGLNHLKILHLRYNQILRLSADVGADGAESVFTGLDELRELDLRNNDLISLEVTDFQPLANLEMLYLDDNDIIDLPVTLFLNNRNLLRLALKSMRLSEIPSAAFAFTGQLEHLELSTNNIKTIPSESFANLPNLKQLILTDMSIESIHDDAFSGLTSLEVLDLLSNSLTTLNKEVLQNLPSLTTLILSANPWTCDCQMYDLVDYIKGTSIVYYTSPWLCVLPNRLNGQPVYLIPEDEFACKPIISSASQSKDVEYDNQAYFECVANGDPKPTIQWLDPKSQEVTSMSNIQNVYTTLEGTVIIIRNAKQDDDGMYTCIASNSNGDDRVEFQLNVQNIPTSKAPTAAPAPTTRSFTCPDVAIIDVVATDITDTSAKLTWAAFNHPMATGYVVEITEFASQVSSPTNELVQPASNITFEVSNLKPGTGYVMCVSVIIDKCPTQTPNEQCKQLQTQGLNEQEEDINALKIKHTNEIIGTALSVFFGTLLILASIFVILWQYRKPKEYTKYDLQSTNKDTARFADVEGVDIEDDDTDVTNKRYVARKPSARFTPEGHTNTGATLDDENSNMSTFTADVEVHGQNGVKPKANGIHDTSLTDIKEEEHDPTYDKVPDENDTDYMNEDALHMSNMSKDSRLSTVGLVDTYM